MTAGSYPEFTAFDRLDPQVQKAVRRAEKRDGFIYGPAVILVDGKYQQVLVNVRFYPKREWFVNFHDGSQRSMTHELWSQLERIQL